MSLLLGALNSGMQACRLHPDIAKYAIGGVATLALQHLFKTLKSTQDWKTIITALEDCMLKLRTALEVVVDRLLRDYPDKAARDAHLQSLAQLDPTEVMNARWEATYRMILEVKTDHDFILTLSFADQKGHMKSLEVNFAAAKLAYEKLDKNITMYSCRYFRAVTEEKRSTAWEEVTKDYTVHQTMTPI